MLRRRCQKSAAKRIPYPQATRPETAPYPASACLVRTSSPCSNVSRSSLTATETAAAASACASSSSPQSVTRSSKSHDGYARGLMSSVHGSRESTRALVEMSSRPTVPSSSPVAAEACLMASSLTIFHAKKFGKSAIETRSGDVSVGLAPGKNDSIAVPSTSRFLARSGT
jgi:hypothetical protein